VARRTSNTGAGRHPGFRGSRVAGSAAVADGSVPPTSAPAGGTDPTGAARTVCLNLLTARARTRAELAEALAKREFPDEIATGVLDRLADVGLIDDADFAASFVAVRHRERGLARAEIVRQLEAKGVDREIAMQAADGIDDESERATARRLVDRKLRTMSSLDDVVKTRRLVGLLARKGYSASVCYSVVRDAVGDLADEFV
jgi:regulatory protein